MIIGKWENLHVASCREVHPRRQTPLFCTSNKNRAHVCTLWRLWYNYLYALHIVKIVRSHSNDQTQISIDVQCLAFLELYKTFIFLTVTSALSMTSHSDCFPRLTGGLNTKCDTSLKWKSHLFEQTLAVIGDSIRAADRLEDSWAIFSAHWKAGGLQWNSGVKS